ncbi:hypothetical protein D1J36_005340 [Riemerella anatipestifer]|uniref:FISUMP domain-containing protein n=1 Tax=Riemerella anatipestifer TaxID=34085 RepID=UPI0012AD223F|nr:FISUMP domain-containing protein [Riemerella anatipestifer]USL94731.1 hypothetical protein D1J36_005340 [Riemerella anatipestifer]
MKNKITFLLILAVTLQCFKAQVVLQALDAYFSVTLESGKKRIASIYDADYFPYNINPRSAALWQRDIAADGIPEALVIDHQGKITTTGLRVGIPVMVQGNGILPAYSTDITIPVTYTEDGNSRVLRFSWEAQSVTSATTYIVATIRSLGGDLLIKKLDMNMGFGTDVEGLLMGAFSYPYRYAGVFSATNVQYKLYAVTGIPDRCLGKTTSACVGYGVNEREHDFVYTPLVGPDGKVWLGNNLGAEYAKYGSTWFDPAAQAGTLDANTGQPLDSPNADQIKKDWRAYGSLFQWQRKPDGHELINWAPSVPLTPKYNSTYNLANSWTFPNTNLFISNGNADFSWVNNAINGKTNNLTLWQGNGENNPCPVGYHVPTHSELHTVIYKMLGYDENNTPSLIDVARWANERVMKLPAPGLRNFDGMLQDGDIVHMYWTSTEGRVIWNAFGTKRIGRSRALSYTGVILRVDEIGWDRATGMSVRCLQD